MGPPLSLLPVISLLLLGGVLFVEAQPPPPLNCSAVPVEAFKTYVLKSPTGLEAHFIPFGGALTHLFYPDKDGVKRDLVLGFDNPMLYCSSPIHPYFGVLVGRYANRIANGTFTLDGVTYHVPLNDNAWDALHGGTIGFDLHAWEVLAYTNSSLTLRLYSPNGDMGFPGDLTVVVQYTVIGDTWTVNYRANTSSVTVINLTHHTYWNFNGFAHNSETALDHILHINSSSYISTDSHLIATGEIGDVQKDFWLNFNTPKPVGQDIKYGKVTPTGGYDNDWILSSSPNWETVAAVTVTAPLTGISVALHTNRPTVQFYSGTSLNSTIPRKTSQIYGNPPQYYARSSTVCLEAQDYIDAVNHPNFPSTVLKKGDIYSQTTSYKFSRD